MGKAIFNASPLNTGSVLASNTTEPLFITKVVIIMRYYLAVTQHAIRRESLPALLIGYLKGVVLCFSSHFSLFPQHLIHKHSVNFPSH